MGNREFVYKNWLPTFLGSMQLYLSYYQLKPVTTTRYLVELMGNRGGFSKYFSCSFSIFTYLFTVVIIQQYTIIYHVFTR